MSKNKGKKKNPAPEVGKLPPKFVGGTKSRKKATKGEVSQPAKEEAAVPSEAPADATPVPDEAMVPEATPTGAEKAIEATPTGEIGETTAGASEEMAATDATPDVAGETAAPTTDGTTAEASPAAKEKKGKAKREPKPKKVSALDAAARVLAEEGKPMTTKEMIDAMAAKGYWTSPGGQTPQATLYSAILRELKSAEPRFKKTERGKFARA
jgi:hypothetical protein